MGFALAIGLSFGLMLENRVHFGVYLGSVFDPTVRELQNETSVTTPTGTDIVDLPTKRVMGKFFAWGIMLSIAI